MKVLLVEDFDGLTSHVCLGCLSEVEDGDGFCRRCGFELDFDGAYGDLEDILKDLENIKKEFKYET